jgi:hypothetical protein
MGARLLPLTRPSATLSQRERAPTKSGDLVVRALSLWERVAEGRVRGSSLAPIYCWPRAPRAPPPLAPAPSVVLGSAGGVRMV